MTPTICALCAGHHRTPTCRLARDIIDCASHDAGTYRRGCRCDTCHRAWATYCRDWRARKQEAA